ncbi:MAG: pyridoxal phosphate-dependent aminotransferase, partial [Gemmataceae bacterium]
MAITTSPAGCSVPQVPRTIRTFLGKMLRTFQGQSWNPASKQVLCSSTWIERWNEAFGESMDHEINLGSFRFPGRPIPRQHLCGVSENRSVHDQGLGELREFVAREFHQSGKGAISPSEEVLITQGASGALRTVLDTFMEKGDSLVLFDPCSPWYSHQARCRGLKVRWVEQRHDRGEWRICLKQLARAMRGSQMMVVSTPGNPTANLLSPDERDHISWLAKRHDVLVVWDETFHCFLDAEVTSKHSTPDRTRNCSLIIGELDKSLGLESLQIGWIIG